MIKPLGRLGAAAVALALALPAMAQDASTVVATVNGKEITLGHMVMARASLPAEYQQLESDQLWEGLLNQLVQQEALAQDERAKESDRVKVAMENERRSLLAAEVVSAVVKTAVSEQAVQDAYNAQYANADQGQEFNASHILVETQEEAAAIVAELEGGAEFAVVAQEKSTGPSGPNGGSLGWFGAGMMVPPFEAAVMEMDVGAVSAPVQTQFGWHVIKLNDSRAVAAPELESVRAEIEQEIQRTAVLDFITNLTETGDITRTGAADIDTSVLMDDSILGD